MRRKKSAKKSKLLQRSYFCVRPWNAENARIRSLNDGSEFVYDDELKHSNGRFPWYICTYYMWSLIHPLKRPSYCSGRMRHGAPFAASLSVVARDEERRCADEDAAHGLVVVHRVYLKVASPRDCSCQTARSLWNRPLARRGPGSSESTCRLPSICAAWRSGWQLRRHRRCHW